MSNVRSVDDAWIRISILYFKSFDLLAIWKLYVSISKDSSAFYLH